MKVYYLEIVTTDVAAVCETYTQIEKVVFSEKIPTLGGARTAQMAEGGIIGIRAPMHENEMTVVRPYVLVKDIQAAVDAATKSGAQVAVPPMELGEFGKCAIIIQGGIESGFWQL